MFDRLWRNRIYFKTFIWRRIIKYIKNLLNLPDNITDLLITFGNDKTEAQMKEALKQEENRKKQ